MKHTQRRSAAILLLALASLAIGGVAHAFNDPQFFHASAFVAATGRPGAGGIYGTGGQSDHGVRCSHCHTGAVGAVGVTVSASPAFGTSGGSRTYTPGQRYAITVALTGAHLHGMRAADDANGMAIAFEDASGRPAGRLDADSGTTSATCRSTYPFTPTTSTAPPAGATTVVYGDCHGVVSLGGLGANATWTFDWVAPSGGDLSVHVGAVDGDHNGSSSLGDDVAETNFPLVAGS